MFNLKYVPITFENAISDREADESTVPETVESGAREELANRLLNFNLKCGDKLPNNKGSYSKSKKDIDIC